MFLVEPIPTSIIVFTAQDGIFSKFATPSIPALSELNFTYNNDFNPIDLNLVQGLEYNLTGLPEGLELDENLELSLVIHKELELFRDLLSE